MSRNLVKILHLEKKSFYIGIIILQLITAIILGLLIFQKVFVQKSTNKDIANNGVVDLGLDVSESPMIDTNTLWNENNILDMPGPQASDEEEQEHYAAAAKIAEDDSTIDLIDCKGTPVVARVKQNSKVELINKSSTGISVFVYANDNSYKIPANGQVSLTANFSKGLGLYGYGCDGSSELSGLIFVSE